MFGTLALIAIITLDSLAGVIVLLLAIMIVFLLYSLIRHFLQSSSSCKDPMCNGTWHIRV